MTAVALAWALVATGTLVWVANTSAAESRAQLWNAESTLLNGVQASLVRIDYDNSLFLSSGNRTLGIVAWSDFVSAAGVLRESTLQPAYSVAVELNLTWNFLNCASDGYYAYMEDVVGAPADLNLLLPFFLQTANLTHAVSLSLGAVAPHGTDPLAQLGPTSVHEVQSDMGSLYMLMASPGHCPVPPITPPVVTASS